MAQAIISRRGGGSGGYATVKFENYGTAPAPTKVSVTALSEAMQVVGTSIGDSALFAVYTEKGSVIPTVTYTSNLARGTITGVYPRTGFAATSVGNYALFGGGYYSSTYQSNVDAYNSSLTKVTYPTALSEARSYLAATTVGSYALFGGGASESNGFGTSSLDAYNANLTKTLSSLSTGRRFLAATSIGNYALFGGGHSTDNTNNVLSVVDAYTSGLVRTTATSLGTPRQMLAATSTMNHALFGGGHQTHWSSSAQQYYYYTYSAVDAYSDTLVRTTATSLSANRHRMGATKVGQYAIFGGGSTFPNINEGTYGQLKTVDAYNSSLARTVLSELSVGRHGIGAATAGSHAIFVGGWINHGTYTTAVDAYKATDNFLSFNVYKDSKYKFQNMSEEATYTSNVGTVSAPTPVTGYIKFKNTTIS